MAPTPAQFPGMAPLAARYDGFILDLWGVIHDGVRPYEGAVDCLRALKAADKPAVLLSNAPRPATVVSDLMEEMGIDRGLYRGAMTSGDAVILELRSRRDPFFAGLTGPCLFVGRDPDRSWLVEAGIDAVDDPAAAGWILNLGPMDFDHGAEDYRTLLESCRRLDLPMVCANPDRTVMREGREVICAGVLADLYESLGGAVAYRGKPDPAIYGLAQDLLALPAGAKVACVGDGLHTDMPGAAAAGLDGVFVTGGLNAAPLGISHGEQANPAKLGALLADHGLTPVAAIPAFVWGN